jgi:single-strand DNA-binding protein
MAKHSKDRYSSVFLSIVQHSNAVFSYVSSCKDFLKQLFMLKLLAIGHLGKDAVVATMDNGKKVINFTVAHTEKWKDVAGTPYEKTIWISCAWWTDRLGIVEYLKKGTQIYAEGVPDVQAYAGQQGEPRAQLKLRVSSLQLLGSKNQGQSSSASNPTASEAARGWQAPSIPSQYPTDASDITQPIDDLPF